MPIAVGVTCALLFSMIVVGLLAFFWIKRKRQNADEPKITIENKQNIPADDAVEDDGYILPTAYQVPLKSIVSGVVPIPTLAEFQNLKQCDMNSEDHGSIYPPQKLNHNPIDLSFDHNRIKLQKQIGGSDSVDANWISHNSDECNYDGVIYSSHIRYNCIKFGVGASPIPATILHHFQMIQDGMFDTVIGFSDEENKNPFQIGKVYHFDSLSVKIQSQVMITRNLTRSEMFLSDEQSAASQTNHRVLYFEFDAWPKTETTNAKKVTFNIVSSMCFIRDEIRNGNNPSPKIFIHDSNGGIRGSAVFLAMYQLIDEVDDSLNSENKLKKYVDHVDVYGIVNRLRNDRKMMVDDFKTYKLLHQCLGYYGLNRKSLIEYVSKIKKKMNEKGLLPKKRNRLTRIISKAKEPKYLGKNKSSQENEYVLFEYDENEIDAYYYYDNWV